MSEARRKGTAFETAVVQYLQAHGFPYAERRALHGANDRGDITGIPGVVLELKATRRIDVGEAVTETERERQNANAQYGITIIKRRNHPIAGAYAILPLEQLTDLLRDTPVSWP